MLWSGRGLVRGLPSGYSSQTVNHAMVRARTRAWLAVWLQLPDSEPCYGPGADSCAACRLADGGRYIQSRIAGGGGTNAHKTANISVASGHPGISFLRRSKRPPLVLESSSLPTARRRHKVRDRARPNANMARAPTRHGCVCVLRGGGNLAGGAVGVVVAAPGRDSRKAAAHARAHTHSQTQAHRHAEAHELAPAHQHPHTCTGNRLQTPTSDFTRAHLQAREPVQAVDPDWCEPAWRV